MQHVCEFIVVDVNTHKWSNWGEFRGDLPPAEIKRRKGSTSDEFGGDARYAFISAGGIK